MSTSQADRDDKSLLKINDNIDFLSILFVLLSNINFLVSVVIVSFFISSIFYITSPKIYTSSSLIEIQNDSGFGPNNLVSPLQFSKKTLEAELEIYKSRGTIQDSITNLENYFEPDEIPSVSKIRSNLSTKISGESLIQISFTYDDKNLTPIILDNLTEEFIKDRKEFRKQSSAAARKFISEELPRVRLLLTEAENKLNNFKLSTNSTDIIFDDQTRNTKLKELQDRIDEINFREVELKEFYKSNHPIYMTLSQQKNLVLQKIKDIEKEIPEIPNRQRTIENLKREVKTYSDVIQNLSTEEVQLSIVEASSISNVRIINYASSPRKVSPRLLNILLFTLLALLVAFTIQSARYFLNNKISNPDALSDFIGNERIIGQLPLLKNIENLDGGEHLSDYANELLHRTIYEITHSDKNFSSILFTSSRKNVGKTEISHKIFKMLDKEGKKVCLIDLDYRRASLSNKQEKSNEYNSFEDFFKDIDQFKSGDSLFIPAFKVDSIPAFLKSNEFKENIEKLKNDYDYVICDTPPWSIFVDAKIIKDSFEQVIYIVGNEITTFKDIEIFENEIKTTESVSYFFNKFNYFFNILGLTYQYPYYSRDYYYDYGGYQNLRKEVNISSFFQNLLKKFKGIFKKWPF